LHRFLQVELERLRVVSMRSGRRDDPSEVRALSEHVRRQRKPLPPLLRPVSSAVAADVFRVGSQPCAAFTGGQSKPIGRVLLVKLVDFVTAAVASPSRTL
jgi:hypothetical protein